MRHQDAQHLINEIEYLDGWKLFWIPIDFEHSYMYWWFRDEEGRQECRKWLIVLRNATPSDIVQTALRAAIDAQEHEVRERFRFKGKRIYGPHFDPDALVGLASYKKNLSLKGAPERERCSDCDGKGITPSWPHTSCATCKGIGWNEF